MKLCRTFNQSCEDHTKNSIFQSAVIRFRYNKDQFLDVDKVSYDIHSTTMNDWETEATRLLQNRERELGRFLPMASMHVAPMYSYSDGIAMLLPLDNKVNRTYLTYRDPLWHEFLRRLYRAFSEENLTEGLESLRTMVVAYNMHAPYSVEIRHDSQFSLEPFWDKRDAQYFGDRFSKLLLGNLSTAIRSIKDKLPGYEKYIPNLNPTKSTGFNQRFYDGRQVTRDLFTYVPASLRDSDTNLWSRVDRGPFKEDCIRSGWVDKNLDYLLENIDDCLANPSSFVRLVDEENCSIHKMSFRTNNADPSLNSEDEFKAWSKGQKVKFFHKDRNWCRCVKGSDGGIRYVSGTYHCDKLNEELNRTLGFTDPLDSNKKRAVYPAPTATFSPPYTCLFRALLSDLEESKMGFPSNRTNILENYDEYFKLIGNQPRTWVAFDRKNSEQTISANYSFFELLVGKRLSKILEILGYSIFPSTEGPRVVKGGLPSGSSSTTFDNVVFGLFETCNVITVVTKAKVRDVIDKVLDCLERKSGIVSIGAWLIKLNLGTDDQIIGFSSSKFSDNQNLKEYVSSTLKPFEERFLSFEVGSGMTVFGMTFYETSVEVSKVLGLNKLFLAEKEKLGDAIALKMYCRSLLLPEYIGVIQSVFSSLDLGTFRTFKLGADNYFKQISKFGFDDVVDTNGKHYHGFDSPLSDIFNEYSMSEKLIIGEALKVYDEDFIKRPKKFESDDVLRWLSKFQKFLNIS